MRRYPWLALLLTLALSPAVYAGGSIHTNVDGLPLHWDTQETVFYHPDGGALKSSGGYDRAASLDLVRNAFQAWTSVHPSIRLRVQEDLAPFSEVNINASNVGNYFNVGTSACYDDDDNTPCLNPIIFDEDGEIIDKLFGTCSKFSILGFAGFDDIDDGSADPQRTIVKRGQALFSGACLPDANGNPLTKDGCSPCKRTLTDLEIRTIVTHEIGHLLGMDHSQVNPQVARQCAREEGCPPEAADGIPTMYPILVNKAATDTLHADDAAYFIKLYGSRQDHCSVSGTVFASDGRTEVRGVEVVARNTDPEQGPFDAVAFVSGAEAPRFNSFQNSQGNCREHCGDYFITHLRDGQTYQLCAQQINANFTDGSSLEPVDPPFRLFDDICPAGLTLTCDCSAGCRTFAGQDIVTDADPATIEIGSDDPALQGPINSSDGGGCSLVKPKTLAWPAIKKLLEFSLGVH